MMKGAIQSLNGMLLLLTCCSWWWWWWWWWLWGAAGAAGSAAPASADAAVAGIVNQFTRSAAAAQRVLELMDNLPDIDMDAGKQLSREEIKGDLAMHGVRFAYQVREHSSVELCGPHVAISTAM